MTRCPAKTVPKPPLPRRGPSRYSASNASRSLPPTQAGARKSGWLRVEPGCDPLLPSSRAALNHIIPPGLVVVGEPRSPGGGVGVTGATGSPCRGLVNMEEVLRRLSPLSPQGVDARGSEAGEPGLGGARVEGREAGDPVAPANSATLGFDARASSNATEPGHAPPKRVAPGDGPAHLALINPDAAPAVPQPIGASPYLHTTLNVSSTPLCKYMPGSSAGAGPACKCGGLARRGNRFWESLCSNRICFGCCAGLFLYMYVCMCIYRYKLKKITAPLPFLGSWFAAAASRIARR